MKRYADPYVAGFCLGLVLLASFAFAGRGVGVSGTFVWSAAALAAAFEQAEAGASAVESGSSIAAALQTVLGIMVGGFASALLARRFKFTIASKARLLTAFAGGAVMGVGAYLARGCTSGLALSGGALLGAGSWIFMLAAFAAAYAFAPLVRKAWHS
ncbi:MAG TPA: YeeE/YedE thiosulfate transporter family protein [Thermoanaerobaculia bacterium]|nr:YeeE/YedE thiosulfate transporter family protein [Thermoanaerobaculia bacterium]